MHLYEVRVLLVTDQLKALEEPLQVMAVDQPSRKMG